jgi:xanthine/uracil permease
MILASGMDSASVLITFGLLQVFTALLYGIPMPVQPLKAVAAMVIAQHLTGPIIYGAALSIGIAMLFLTVTGLIDWLARIIPKAVIRGIQFGLGLQLSSLALTNYVQHDGISGYFLAAISFAVTIALLRNRKYPPALIIIALGVAYAFAFNVDAKTFSSGFGIAFPRFHAPRIEEMLQGFLLLALPQIPLSLGNSLLATRQIAHDLFPEKSLSLRKIGLTYSLMNIFSPFLGGIPVCHGSGGMAGHYLFGARTGGSVVIYGGYARCAVSLPYRTACRRVLGGLTVWLSGRDGRWDDRRPHRGQVT